MAFYHEGDHAKENIDQCLSKANHPAVFHDVRFEVIETGQGHNTAPTWAESLEYNDRHREGSMCHGVRVRRNIVSETIQRTG